MSGSVGETTNCTSDQVQGDDLTASHSNYQCHTSADQQTREVTHTHSKNGTSLVVSSYEKADVATGRLVVSLDEGCQCLWAEQDKKTGDYTTKSFVQLCLLYGYGSLGITVCSSSINTKQQCGRSKSMTVHTNTTMPDHGSPHVESGVKKKIENVVDTETTEKTKTDLILINQDADLQHKTTMLSTADASIVSRDLNSSIPLANHDEQQASFSGSTQKEQQSPLSQRRNPSGKKGAKKQRPPKRIRDRMKSTPVPGVTELATTDGQQRREDKVIEGKRDDHRFVAEQVPSPLRVPSAPLQDTHYYRQHLDHHYSPSEPSLRKLVKDLHRCDISIMRYQQILLQQCNQAMCNVRRVFAMLRIGLNAREEDIMRELQSLRQSASLILQRRKATAICLRKLSENATRLEEPQVQELKHQLKQFVTDRKVDEEIGTTRCFYADPDDLLPQIMGFGRVSTIQPSYISWNENPWDAVEKSAIKVQLHPNVCMPPSHSPTCLPQPQSLQQINSHSCQDQLIASQSQPQHHHPITIPLSTTIDNNSSTSNLSTSGEDEKCCTSTILKPVGDSTVNTTSLQTASSLERPDTQNQDEEKTEPTELNKKEDCKEDECDCQTPEPDNRQEENEATICDNNSVVEREINVEKEEEQLVVENEQNTEEEEGLVMSKESTSPQPSLEDDVTENDEEDEEKESTTDDADTVDLTSSPPVDTIEQADYHRNNSSETSDASDSISALQNISQQQTITGDEEKKEETVKEQRVLCKEYEEGEFGRRRKYSPEQLAVIQERVRESLQQQGVFLYDPFTGKVNKPSSSTGNGKEIEDHTRKKKTPTQLRRERKKRQRERERKQRETERTKQQPIGRRFRGDSIRTPMSTFDDSGIATSGSSSSQEEMSPRIRKGASEIKTIVHIVRPTLQRYRYCKPVLLERPHPTRDRVTITSTRGTRDREKSHFRV